VEPADRRSGRATVAVLAAEEVLRGWGCRRAEVRVPADATAALRLAAALGYGEVSRDMLKTLGAGPPPLPPGAVIRPMTPEEYPAWLAAERAAVIDALTARAMPPEQAAAEADRSYASLLPDGPASADTLLRRLLRDGEPAGSLWVRTGGGLPDGAGAYVFDVEVAAAYRRQGLGRALLGEAERLCLAAGVPTLGLQVFTENTAALRLYTSLGYRTTGVNHVKSLA
jgi:ribosomal protein S18 acetylase RimI-like enzyme